MANYNYAERFENVIEEQYQTELTSFDFGLNTDYKFIDAQTIKMADLTVSGYKDHARDGSKNRGTIQNTWIPYMLKHDRNVEFYVDEADVDETNQVLSAANITAKFNSEQAIPELDKYRYSKAYEEYTKLGQTANTTALTNENVLTVIDDMMAEMDEAGVPASGRRLKVTPQVNRLIKEATELQRFINVSPEAKTVNRNIVNLDDVEIQVIPSDRMKTEYDYTEGAVAGAGAEQINMILFHPSAIISPIKISQIHLWPQGSTPESAYGWLYQNRMYMDCFIVTKKVAGIAFNVGSAPAGETPEPETKKTK